MMPVILLHLLCVIFVCLFFFFYISLTCTLLILFLYCLMSVVDWCITLSSTVFELLVEALEDTQSITVSAAVSTLACGTMFVVQGYLK